MNITTMMYTNALISRLDLLSTMCMSPSQALIVKDCCEFAEKLRNRLKEDKNCHFQTTESSVADVKQSLLDERFSLIDVTK